jgi:hypothetical protein
VGSEGAQEEQEAGTATGEPRQWGGEARHREQQAEEGDAGLDQEREDGLAVLQEESKGKPADRKVKSSDWQPSSITSLTRKSEGTYLFETKPGW